MEAAQKLINDDKAVLVFATTNSNTSLAVLPLLTEAKIPQVTGGLSVDLTKQGSAYIFRKVGAGNVFESTLVDYLVQQRGFKSFAIISDSSAYGTGQADYEQAALRRNNLESVAREAYEPNATDFKEQLTRIIALKPDVLLLGGSEVASGLIAKQARELGFTGQIAGGAATGTPKFIEMAGNEAAEGVIFASPYVDNNLNDQTRDFATRYQAKWGSEPENHGAKAYDGAMLAVEAIKRSCDNLTGEEIARQLHGTQNYQGLQGVFNFQENGEGIAVAQMGIIHDGKLTPLK
jgi:branched-chain amino acid transport system substrate-binding protein